VLSVSFCNTYTWNLLLLALLLSSRHIQFSACVTRLSLHCYSQCGPKKASADNWSRIITGQIKNQKNQNCLFGMAATERRTDRITIKYKKDNKKKMKAKVNQDKLLTMEFRYTVCDTGVFGIVQFQTHYMHARTHTHTRLTALFTGLPGSAGTREVKPIWILLKQQTVSGSGISWAICKSAPRSRQITMPAPHHSVFYRPDALPAAQPTESKH